MAIKLYRFRLSGHCHRVELFLSLLRLPYERIDVDLAGGAQHRPEFLALNPFGQVPVLDDGGTVLPDSNAILVYLAGKYDPDARWLPRAPVRAAAVQRWLSIAAGPVAFGPASARLARVFGARRDVAEATARATALFAVMDDFLARARFLAGEDPTIADLAVYTYVAHAPEGGIALAPYPQIRAWLARVEALPGFVAMPPSPIPA